MLATPTGSGISDVLSGPNDTVALLEFHVLGGIAQANGMREDSSHDLSGCARMCTLVDSNIEV